MSKKFKNSNEMTELSSNICKVIELENIEDLKSIINFLDIGIIVVDDEDNIVLINPYSLKLFELTDINQYANKILNELKRIEKSKNKEISISNSKNEKIPVILNFSKSKLKNKHLKIYSLLNIAERKKAIDNLLKLNNELEEIVKERTLDLEKSVGELEIEVKNRKLIEKELRVLINKEKELNQLRTKFVETVSHELRTPLTVIRSTAQLLELYDEKFKKEDKSNYLNRIINMVDSLTDLIKNVNIIESDSNYEDIKVQKVNVLFLIEKNIEHLQKIQNKKHQFIIENNLKINEIDFDIKFFNLLINNIISNAIKYSNTGSKINIILTEQENTITIVVKDEGIGISENDINNVFTAFYRGVNVGANSGTGLGLKVVKDILNQFNGKIHIESKLNEGTKVTIILPKNYEE